MIDKGAFVDELEALAERFNRTVSERMAARYFAYLTQRMSTSQFVAAAQVIYTEDTFWPPPVRFLEAVQQDLESEAEAVWQRTIDEVNRNEHPDLSELDDATVAALKSVGKHRAIGLAREDRLDFVRQRFVDTFLAHRHAERHAALQAPDESKGELEDANDS